MMNIRISFLVGILILVGGVFGGQHVQAAQGEGTATVAVGTGGTSAADASFARAGSSARVVVGTQSVMRLKLVVGAHGIAPMEDNILIQIPQNLFPSRGWTSRPQASLTDVDTIGEWAITYTDTNATTHTPAMTFAASTATKNGMLMIQSDQRMDVGDVVNVYAVVNDTHYSRSATKISIRVDDAGNAPSPIASSPTVTTTPARILAGIGFGTNSVVGSAGLTTITLTAPFALDSGDVIHLTFPPSIDLSGITSHQTVSGTFNTTGAAITCDDTEQVLTCIVHGVTGTSGTIILENIQARYASSGQSIPNFEIEDEGVADHDIATIITASPSPVPAALPSEGALIKGESSSTVFFIDADGARRPFVDEQTFSTHAGRFRDVVVVPDSDIQSYVLGAPMLPKEGTVLVKTPDATAVYAVAPQNTLRWITLESLAANLYGNAWADYVIDVPTGVWGHFTIGDDITSINDIEVDNSILRRREEL